MADNGRGFALPVSFLSGEATQILGNELKPALQRNFEYISWFMNAYVPQLVDGVWDLDFPIDSDLVSTNWDGTSPPDLSSEDTGASAGWALDTSEGSMQLEGNLFVGGDISLSGSSTLSSTAFVSGSAGWQIEGDGTAELNDVIVRGALMSLPQGVSFPGSPEDGEVFYRTDLNVSYRYDGNAAAWIEVDQVTDPDRLGTSVVTSAKINDLAVTTGKIDNGAVTNAKIGNAAVDTAQINNAAITSAKIDDLAVTTAKIDDAAITTAKVDTAAITTALIDSAAITTALIDNAAITSAKIDDLAVTNAKIANTTITAAKIANATITDTQIANATITAAKIASLDADDITTGTLTGRRIRTAASGERIDIQPSVDAVYMGFYDSGGTERGSVSLQAADTIMAVSGANGWGAKISSSGSEVEAEGTTAHMIGDSGGEIIAVDSSGVYVGSTGSRGGRFFVNSPSGQVTMKIFRDTSTSTAGVLTMSSDVGGANTQNAFMAADGDWANTNGTYGTISDRRLKVKASIKPARSYLEDLNRLKVRKYRMKGHDQTNLGFVADEVAEVFPGLVRPTEEGYDTVKTSVLIPMMVTALQDVTSQMAALQRKVKTLEEGIESLQKQLTNTFLPNGEDING